MLTMPATTHRVIQCTESPINEELERQLEANVQKLAREHPRAIDNRLCELEREWDIERLIDSLAGVIVLAGTAAALWNPWFLLVPGFAGLMVLTHSLFGWSPFLFLVRRLGVRTPQEIAHERYALKALRGDFKPLATITTPEDRMAIADFESEGGAVARSSLPDAADPAVVQEALEAVKK